MNQFVVTLLSQKPCELNRFLNQFYNQKVSATEGAFLWYSPLSNALDSSLLLTTLLDNETDFQIEAFISIEHQSSIKVSKDNINGIIKYLYLIELKTR